MLLRNFALSHDKDIAFNNSKVKKDYGSGGTVKLAEVMWNTNVTSINARGATLSSSYWYLAVGSGDTEPTKDDASLTSTITNLSFISGTVSKANTDIDSILMLTATYKNNTGDSITVKEIGIGFRDYNSNTGVLLNHAILTTPVTINAGDSYTFTCSISV
ncbi:MAG: hypothetical protein J6S67_09730 [Methanobrevibacter sp.]|nr:hypothetical protein [Methanobrevibacter sp.]